VALPSERIKNYSRIPKVIDLPNLIQIQLDSFHRLKEDGLSDLFDEISPIESYDRGLRLYFPGHSAEAQQWGLKYWFGEPKHPIEECIERDLTYASPLYVSVLLAGPEVAEPIKQDIFMGDFPEMTPTGTFIINGTERVVVSQLIRSPGVYFDATVDRATGRIMANAKLIPDRGAWIELETRKNDTIILKFNRKRTVPVTVFLRALAAADDGLGNPQLSKGTDEEIISLFTEVDNNTERQFIASTLQQEPIWENTGIADVSQAALIEFFRRMRPGDPVSLENAREFMTEQLFDQRHYDLERVGRYKLSQKLSLSDVIPVDHRTLTSRDVIALVRRMIAINNGQEEKDDIDHLGNRRVKTVGELVQSRMRIGMRRMERVVKERMSIREQGQINPVSLINIRPVVAAMREFFGSSQLSQFMDQTNPLAELRNKRTLSALGPGGLRRERAGFDVRDVHHSHYGRICPIETPEGPNIGLIGRLANFARVNEYGFIETPYRRVAKSLQSNDPRLLHHQVREIIADPQSGEVILQAGERVTEQSLAALQKLNRTISVVPFVSNEIDYLSADAEDRFIIAQANTPVNEYNEIATDRVFCRFHSDFLVIGPDSISYMDVSPQQVVGVSASLIPFLEHDDANRALMGSNMQAQAVPLVAPEVPIVSTGMESRAALDSGQVLLAEADGEVLSVTSSRIIVREEGGDPHTYHLRKYQRSNQSTCIDQRPAVYKGQLVHKGQVLADSSSTVNGDLALGQNVVVAFVSWEGGNFEDAVLISQRLVEEDRFTSVHIEQYEIEARDTKLGPEELTRDIPNVGEDAVANLDDQGIIRVGAEVEPGDILVGKITPKGEKELTPEERLLRAIFGEKSRDVKDTSLRMPHGERGKVIDVRVFTREDNPDLSAGVNIMVRVFVAQYRKITAGDKMAGRHGNKGVVSRVVAVEDMPYLDDGTPVDIVLNPLGVPSRMNIGQILETHLGWAASRLGFSAVTPVFDGASESEIEAELARAWLMDQAWKEAGEKSWAWFKDQSIDSTSVKNDDEVRLLYLADQLAPRGYDAYELTIDPNYARRATLTEWLRDKGYDPDSLLAFEPTAANQATTEERDGRALAACLRLWLETQGEDTSAIESEELRPRAEQYMAETGIPMPIIGKQILRDGASGDPFDQPVTVGVMTMLKLHHLVEDKVHARSTGPYSLVTQQPLGGKAQFGGQRFGEMEVWALEAYGAAYTLQEMLTIKSDDIQGRTAAYEAIIKDLPIEPPGLPASFRVLVKELQSLGVSVEAISEGGETVRFGKDEERVRPPRMTTGLLGLGEGSGFGMGRGDGRENGDDDL
jgi:DNA-directed RNA polymerase subunit beta